MPRNRYSVKRAMEFDMGFDAPAMKWQAKASSLIETLTAGVMKSLFMKTTPIAVPT